jgi:uncharacterized protein (DUF433 family)
LKNLKEKIRIKMEVKMQGKWKDYIESSPDVLRGRPRIKGTRIPVSLILGYLADGNTIDEILREFPDLTREQISACLDYARELSEFEVAI